jgi:hypothetical protein
MARSSSAIVHSQQAFGDVNNKWNEAKPKPYVPVVSMSAGQKGFKCHCKLCGKTAKISWENNKIVMFCPRQKCKNRVSL